eukprot:9105599-Ditylum_brightwellii.AAC.1
MLRKAGIDVATATAEQKNKALTEAKEAYFATALLASSNRGRYGKLLEELHNDHLKGDGRYPTTLVAAHKLLVNWQHDSRHLSRPSASNDGVAFTTDAEEEIDKATQGESDTALTNDGRVLDRNSNEVRCFICGKKHYANKCPDRDQDKKEKDVVAFTWGEDTWDDGASPGGLMFYTLGPGADHHCTVNANSGAIKQRGHQVILAQGRRVVNPNW